MHNLYSICIISVLAAGYAQVKAFPSEAQCGRRKGRIINGDLAKNGQLPWIASIKYRNLHMCGATIISNRFILSAAHCFETELRHGHIVEAKSASHLSQYMVTLGDYSQLADETHSVNYTIERLIFHKEYRRIPLRNDIVILQLSKEIQWTNHIQPICLPTEDITTSDKAVAAGWGKDMDPYIPKEDNNKLRYIEIKIYDNERCNHMYSERRLNIHLVRTQLCAGRLDEKIQDTNSGDSGGPLVMNLGGREVLVGITSSGTPESVYPKAPGIYTRVFEYLDWIEEHRRGVH